MSARPGPRAVLDAVRARLRAALGRRGPAEAALARPGAVDRAFYFAHAPDVAAAGVEPWRHYLRHGAAEGRDPNPLFSTRGYLQANPDVAAAGLNPLAHYELSGWRENRDPSSGFDGAAYLACFPELPALDVSPLRHRLAREAAGDVEALAPPALESARDAAVFHVAPSPEPAVLDLSRAAYAPVVSILLPAYDTPPRFLREAIQSVFDQTYPRWRLCLVDDASAAPHVRAILEEAVARDARVSLHVSAVNQGIAGASQRALEMADGEFVAFLDHDDQLTPGALAEVVAFLRENPLVDYVYTDHAGLSEDGRITSQALKPGWSPEFFLSTNYLVHLKVIRRAWVERVGGFRQERSVVQDIGLTCRLVEAGAVVAHLPSVAYLWREHAGSVSTGTGGKPAIEALAVQTYDAHLRRRGVPARIHWPAFFRQRRIGVYKLAFEPLADAVAVVVIDPQGHTDPDKLAAQVERTRYGGPVEVHLVGPGAAGANSGVRRHGDAFPEGLERLLREQVDAQVVVLLGPQPTVVERDWLTELVGYLHVDADVAAVGGKVLDSSLRIRAGAFLLLDAAQTLGFGQSDYSNGHWFNGRAASNVEAASGLCLALRRDDLLGAGVGALADPHAGGLQLCCALRSQGRRVVYNPWARVVLAEAEHLPQSLPSPPGATDAFYPPRMSWATPYGSPA